MKMRDSERVFLALPSYDGRHSSACMFSVLQATHGMVTPRPSTWPGSFLTKAFNVFWANAIASDCRYFAMLHDDIGCKPGWLDILVNEQKRLGGVVSVVSPIKDGNNKVSCAMRRHGERDVYHVIGVEELKKLPLTFNSDDVHRDLGLDGRLLVNTGCWIADLSEDWVKKVWFDVQNWLEWDGDTAHVGAMSEDWDFSDKLHALGVPVHATWMVEIQHDGRGTWRLSPNTPRGNT